MINGREFFFFLRLQIRAKYKYKRNSIDYKFRALRSETIPRPDDVYAKGDLGFEPEYVDFEDTRAPMKFEKSITPETESIDSIAVSIVPNVPLTASLQV